MAYTFLKSLSFHMQAQVPRGTKLDLSQNQLVTLSVSVVLSQSAASLILRLHTGLGLSESNPCREACVTRNGLVWLFASSKLLKSKRLVQTASVHTTRINRD